MFGLFKKQRSTETGFENAARFVEVVTRLAGDERMVQLYPHDGWRGSKHERYGWQWMANAMWRQEVLKLLRDAPVCDATFHAPDSLDGWSFTAVSTVPVPRVAKLSLGDTL